MWFYILLIVIVVLLAVWIARSNLYRPGEAHRLAGAIDAPIRPGTVRPTATARWSSNVRLGRACQIRTLMPLSGRTHMPM